MEIPVNRFSYLYRQYTDKKCSAEEMQEFFMLVQDPIHREMLEMLADTHLESIQQPGGLPEIDWEHMYRSILQRASPPAKSEAEGEGGRWSEAAGDGGAIADGDRWSAAAGEGGEKGRVVPFFTIRRVAAAVIIIVLCAGGYFLVRHRQKGMLPGDIISSVAKNDVPPGGDKAVLTLANGTTIVLDSAANGMLAQQGNVKVIKTNQGQLAYDITNEKPTEVVFNTLATPRGGQYQLMLPDGSKVWLNAASSIHYPTAFVGGERRVDITGEAYFEVARDVTKPFIVKVGSPEGSKGMVKVLGTNFNVNAYDDEPAVRTTLLEGAVKVTKDAASAVLEPGQQAELEQAGDIRLVREADLQQVMAWKNGLFAFNGADIHTVMRQITRWYDVDVVFETESREKFHVEMSRNTNVSNVFRILAATGAVHFKIDGKKIVVTQ